MGHYKSKCPKNKSKKTTGKQSENEDTVLMTVEEGLKPCNDIWIVSLAALTDIVNSKVGLFDTKAIRKPVKIGDSKLVYTIKVGQLISPMSPMKGRTKNSSWKTFSTSLVLDQSFNLTAAITKGCSISNKGWMIVVEKNGLKVQFNKEIKTKKVLWCYAGS